MYRKQKDLEYEFSLSSLYIDARQLELDMKEKALKEFASRGDIEGISESKRKKIIVELYKKNVNEALSSMITMEEKQQIGNSKEEIVKEEGIDEMTESNESLSSMITGETTESKEKFTKNEKGIDSMTGFDE